MCSNPFYSLCFEKWPSVCINTWLMHARLCAWAVAASVSRRQKLMEDNWRKQSPRTMYKLVELVTQVGITQQWAGRSLEIDWGVASAWRRWRLPRVYRAIPFISIEPIFVAFVLFCLFTLPFARYVCTTYSLIRVIFVFFIYFSSDARVKVLQCKIV